MATLCAWQAAAGIPAGNAVMMSDVAGIPNAITLPWMYKGRVLMNLNKPLLDSAAIKGLPRTITLVSGLFDLGRGDAAGGFKRPFTEYIDRFRRFLAYDMPKIIMIEEKHLDEVRCMATTWAG